MKIAGCLIALSTFLLSSACSLPEATPVIKKMITGADQKPHLAFSIESRSVMYPGDDISVFNADGASSAVLEIEQSGSNGTKSHQTIPVAPDVQTIKIDSSLFPGLNETDGNAVQSYSLRLTRENAGGGNSEADTSLLIISDRDVKEFPNIVYQSGGDYPPGKGPNAWLAADSDTDVEALVDQNIQNLALTNKKVTQSSVSKAEVSLFPGMDSLPDGISLMRYTIEGTMPRMLIPSNISYSGVSEIFQPSTVTLVVSRTAPPVVVSMRVSE